MKLPLLILLLLISFNTWAKDQAFVDTEDNQIVSIFNKPGKNWKNCAKDPQCRPLGWPDNTAKINVLSPTKKLKVEDPYTGKMTEEEYVFVEYSYTRIEKDKNGKPTGKEWPQAGQGWIDASYLSYTKQKSFYGEDCPPTEKKTCSAPNAVQELVDKFKPIEKSNSNKSVKEVADSLSGVVGQCVINPAKPPTKYAAGNPFDSMVLPSLEKRDPRKFLALMANRSHSSNSLILMLSRELSTEKWPDAINMVFNIPWLSPKSLRIAPMRLKKPRKHSWVKTVLTMIKKTTSRES
jgi:hypothetical protein